MTKFLIKFGANPNIGQIPMVSKLLDNPNMYFKIDEYMKHLFINARTNEGKFSADENDFVIQHRTETQNQKSETSSTQTKLTAGEERKFCSCPELFERETAADNRHDSASTQDVLFNEKSQSVTCKCNLSEIEARQVKLRKLMLQVIEKGFTAEENDELRLIFWAITENDEEMLSVILKRARNVDAHLTTKYGEFSPLHFAGIIQDKSAIESVRRIIKHAKDIHSTAIVKKSYFIRIDSVITKTTK